MFVQDVFPQEIVEQQESIASWLMKDIETRWLNATTDVVFYYSKADEGADKRTEIESVIKNIFAGDRLIDRGD